MRRLRQMIIGALCCMLIAGAVSWDARGETAAVLPQHIQLAEHAVIDAANLPLYEYSVTLRDFLSCAPEDFHAGKIKNTEHYESEYGTWDDIYFYTFTDGYSLTVSGTSLDFGNRHHDNYSQLLTYLDNEESQAPEEEPFPLPEAQARCDRLIKQLDIGYLVPERTVPLSSGTIRQLTAEMKERLHGGKLDCFESFPEEIGAWYLTFRQMPGGIPVTDLTHTPQVRIVLTKDETALLEINSIIDTIDEAKMLPETTSPEDALRYYMAEHPEVQRDDRQETFRISRIMQAYCADIRGETLSLPVRERLCPCWRVESMQFIQIGSETLAVPLSELYRIPGGEKVKPVIRGE